MPSVSATLYTGPFTNAERVDIRRFCGYPSYGPGAAGFQSWRYFQAFGMLEYRLTNIAPEEAQVVRLKLSDLYTLEQAIPVTGGGLDVKQAAVYMRNPYELRERRGLYAYHRRELCAFMGVPAGPSMPASKSIVI